MTVGITVQLPEIAEKTVGITINTTPLKTQQTVSTFRDIRKKVDCIEAERIIYVFDELHRRLILLSGFASISNEQFKKFPESCHRLRAAAQNPDATQKELEDATRDAVRDISYEPTLCHMLRNSKADPRLGKMAGTVSKLKTTILARLTTTQTEEEDKILDQRKAKQKKIEIEEQILKIRKELNVAEDQKEMEVEKRAETIRQLKGDLHQIEQFAEEATRRVISELEKQKTSNMRNSEQKQVKILKETKDLKRDLDKFVTTHREIELNLRTRKFKMENEVENWLAMYDQAMTDLQKQIETIEAAYDIEKEQLDTLKERFEKLKIDYDSIMEERRKKREEEERLKKEFEEKTYSAKVIQAFFRSYKIRKMLKNKNKKGKKGKK